MYLLSIDCMEPDWNSNTFHRLPSSNRYPTHNPLGVEETIGNLNELLFFAIQPNFLLCDISLHGVRNKALYNFLYLVAHSSQNSCHQTSFNHPFTQACQDVGPLPSSILLNLDISCEDLSFQVLSPHCLCKIFQMSLF